MPDFLIPILGYISLIGVGIFAAFYYVKFLKRGMLGGLWGGIIVGVIGAVLGGFLLSPVTRFLTNPKQFEGYINVDFLAAGFGAFLLIWILAKLSHK